LIDDCCHDGYDVTFVSSSLPLSRRFSELHHCNKYSSESVRLLTANPWNRFGDSAAITRDWGRDYGK